MFLTKNFTDLAFVSVLENPCPIRSSWYELFVDAKGVIGLYLKNYKDEWPKMVLRKIAGKFFLFRADGLTQLEFGGRAGAVETPDMKPFWPFGVNEVLWPKPKPYIEQTGPFHPVLPPREGEIEHSSPSDR